MHATTKEEIYACNVDVKSAREEEHKLSAINENDQPLLRTREYGKSPPRVMNREEAQPLLRTREYGTAPPKVRRIDLFCVSQVINIAKHLVALKMQKQEQRKEWTHTDCIQEVGGVHTERFSKSVTVPKLILPPRKRSQSMSGNDTSSNCFWS